MQCSRPVPIVRKEKKSQKIKCLGRIFLEHQGPRPRDIPDKNFMQVAFSVVFTKFQPPNSEDPEPEEIQFHDQAISYPHPIDPF